MLRQTLIIALATFGCLSMAQEQAAKFSFKSPAGPAKRVLEDLSKTAGASLVAGGPVGNDVILLNVTDVTLTEVMDKIASTLHAEWRKEASGWVLYRGPNFEAADKRAEVAARVAEFRTNLKRILDEHKKSGAFTSDTAKKMADAQNKMNEEFSRQSGSGPIRISGNFGQIGQQGPAARAIVALLSRMSDAQVANMTSGSRNVFSLNPTRMQVPMPNGSNQILQQFVRDCQTLKDFSARNQPAEEAGFSRKVVVNGFGADGMGDGDPSLGIGYAILVNQPSLGGSNVSLSLVVADPNGKTIASGQFFLGGSFVPAPDAESQQKPAATNEKPIELSELSKELLKALNMGSAAGGVRAGVRMISVSASSGGANSFTFSGGGEGKTPPLSDALKERVLNPDKYDPMSFAPGEALSLSAEAKGQDLVAYLPDTAFVSLNQMAIGTITPSGFLRAARNQLEIKEEGGWILASPKAPASARDKTVNRQALGNALRLMNSKGYLSLDDWATFATKQTKAPRFGDFDDNYFRLINAPAADAGLGQLGFGGGWQMLQFYGSMTTAQKQALGQSARVALNSLTQYQLGLVHDQVFNSFDGPSVNPQNQGREMVAFSFGGMQGVQNERTFVLPNGIPRNGFLNFSLKQNEIVQANSTTSGGARFMNADSLAFERMRAEKPELASLGPSTQYDEFRMANQRTIGFLFQFSPEVTLNRQLEDNSPGNQAFAPYDRLPADFKKKVDQTVEQLKKSFGGFGGGGPGQVPPP